ncbi:MAG: hypothetical protein HY094_04580 [Candidatus Melainabacteria bacterium]|nr:hypothetical protein [Candidatus Melainabacteria bacterium]
MNLIRNALFELRYFFSPFSREAWHNYDLRKKVERELKKPEQLKDKNA